MTFLRVVVRYQRHTSAIDVRITLQDISQDDLQTFGFMQGLFNVMHIVKDAYLHVRQ